MFDFFFSVCKRWQNIAKESKYWDRFDTAGMGINHSNLIKCLSKLPSYIIRLRICLTDDPVKGINLPSVALVINERCPNLEELYIEGCLLSSFCVFVGCIPDTLKQLRSENLLSNCSSSGSRNSSTAFLPRSLRILSFRNIRASCMPILYGLRSLKHLENLEVLDYSVAYFEEKTRGPWLLHFCPNLKELHLAGSYFACGIGPLVRFIRNLKVLNLSDSCFKVEDLKKLRRCSGNMEELYLCQINFRDEDLSFMDRSTFPSLKIICLAGSRITMQSVVRLFRDCRSLRRFYSNSADGSKCGFYTFTGRDFVFHDTPKCSEIHLCKYKHHI